MSYKILTLQYKEKLIDKIKNFIKRFDDEPIEFDVRQNCYIEEGYDDKTQKYLTGINENGSCMGEDYHLGEECDFELELLGVLELSIIMDALLEGNYKVLQFKQ